MPTPKAKPRQPKLPPVPELTPLQALAGLDQQVALIGAGYHSFVDEAQQRLAVVQAGLGQPEAAVERARRIGQPYRRILALAELAIALPGLGEPARGRAALEEALALAASEALHETFRSAVHGQLATAQLAHGEREAARRSFETALLTLEKVNNRGETVRAPVRYLFAAGQPAEAVALLVRRAGDFGHLRAFHTGFLAYLRDQLVRLRDWPGVGAIAQAVGSDSDQTDFLRLYLPAMVEAGAEAAFAGYIEAGLGYASTLFEALLAEVEPRGPERLAPVLERALARPEGADFPADQAAQFAGYAARLDPARGRRLAEAGRAAFAKESAGGVNPGRGWIASGLALAWVRLGELAEVRAALAGLDQPRCYHHLVAPALSDGRRELAEALVEDLERLGRATPSTPERLRGLLWAAGWRHRWGPAGAAQALVEEALALAKDMAARERNELHAEAARTCLELGDLAGAWAATKKVTGKYQGEQAWVELLGQLAQAGRWGLALEAAPLAGKAAGQVTVAPLQRMVDALEAGALRQGKPIAVDVF